MARERHGTGRRGGRIAAGLALALALAGIGLLAPPVAGSQQAASAAPAAQSSTPPAWSAVNGAAPRFALDVPEFKKLPAASGFFHNTAGATEDRLSRGSLQAAEAPFVEVVLRHRTAQPPATLFVTLARLAASEGYALLHLSAPAGFSTKFGGFASATAWLANDRTERPCLVFRHEDGGADFEIAGWYCGAEGSDPEPQTLACMLDRLTLDDAVDDPGLKRIFAAAAHRPAACPASPPETVTGGISAPSAAAQEAAGQTIKGRKAKAHKPKAHKPRGHKARHPRR